MDDPLLSANSWSAEPTSSRPWSGKPVDLESLKLALRGLK